MYTRSKSPETAWRASYTFAVNELTRQRPRVVIAKAVGVKLTGRAANDAREPRGVNSELIALSARRHCRWMTLPVKDTRKFWIFLATRH